MFAERFKQTLDYLDKSVVDITKELGYNSPEKIYRFLRTNDSEKESLPSFEFLRDFSIQFDFINLNWLITGNGEMLSEDTMGIYVKGNNNQIRGLSFKSRNKTEHKIEQLERKCEQLTLKYKALQQLLEEKERVISTQKELNDVLKEYRFKNDKNI